MTEATPWLDVFLDVPGRKAVAAQAFWSAVTGWPVSAPRGDRGQFRSLLPPAGRACLRLQELDERPGLHLDLMSHDQAGDAERLERLGGQLLAMVDGLPILSSPAGQVFCLVADDEPRPPVAPGTIATVWPDGHRSRVTHVCLDVPADEYAAELAFWRAATAWTPSPASRPEYTFLTWDGAGRDRAPALRLLLQRLDTPGEGARAHLDIGTDDIAAEVDRLLALGAEDVGRFATWHVLRDPVTALPFCVTDQMP